MTPPIDAAHLQSLHDKLRAGTETLRSLPARDLTIAWEALVADVLDQRSTFWDPKFEEAVAAETGMHRRTLHASLRVGLDGLRCPDRFPVESRTAEPMAAVLAGNVPVLAPQILLPALLRRRGALIKPASNAPTFTERFVDALRSRLGISRTAYLSVRWPGGDELDRVVGTLFDRIAVYGGEGAVARFANLERTADQMVLFGPKSSVALLSDHVAPDLDGLARDVALFEQRGCLSVTTVYLLEPHGSPHELAAGLSRALDALAEALPPAADMAATSAARQWMDVARLTGRPAFGTPGRSGVVVDAPGAGRSPGGRSVSVRPTTVEELTPILTADRDRIQGLSSTGIVSIPEGILDLAHASAWRIAPAGELQHAGIDWRNGGVDLIEWLS